MKKVLIILFFLLLYVNVKTQNSYSESNIYYNSTDTLRFDKGLKVSVFANNLTLKDSVLRRHMDLSVSETETRGFFDDDGSGVFFLISLYGFYREIDYYHCSILPMKNSFMRFTLYENIHETNALEIGDTLRIIGCIEHKGYLFVVIAREFVKDEDVEILFEHGQGEKEIRIYGDDTGEMPSDDKDDYFRGTDFIIPYKYKRMERPKKFFR